MVIDGGQAVTGGSTVRLAPSPLPSDLRLLPAPSVEGVIHRCLHLDLPTAVTTKILWFMSHLVSKRLTSSLGCPGCRPRFGFHRIYLGSSVRIRWGTLWNVLWGENHFARLAMTRFISPRVVSSYENHDRAGRHRRFSIRRPGRRAH